MLYLVTYSFAYTNLIAIIVCSVKSLLFYHRKTLLVAEVAYAANYPHFTPIIICTVQTKLLSKAEGRAYLRGITWVVVVVLVFDRQHFP